MDYDMLLALHLTRKNNVVLYYSKQQIDINFDRR